MSAFHGKSQTPRGREYADGLLISTQFAERDAQRHHVYVKSTLRVFARVTQLEQVEDRLNVAVEAVIALSGERSVAPGEVKDRLPRILVQFIRRRDAFTRRVLADVALVVKRGGVALVIRWNDSAAECRRPARTVVDLLDAVSLSQILVRVADAVDDAEIGLEYRLAVFERRIELEPVSDGRAAGGDVATERDVQIVAQVVVEIVFVEADAGVLHRVDAERESQKFIAALILADKRVNVGRVGRRIERYQRRVHVAGSERRYRQRGREPHQGYERQGQRAPRSESSSIHRIFSYFLLWKISGNTLNRTYRTHRACRIYESYKPYNS